MTNAGWYPDPAGAPDTYRYWDGQSWSEHTSSNPYGGQQPQQPAQQPPPPPAPPAGSGGSYGALGPTPGAPGGGYGSGGYGSGGYGSGGPGGPGGPGGYGPGGPWQPEQPGGSGGSTGKTIGIVLGGVAALVVLAMIAFFAVRAVAGGDDDDTAAGGSDSSTSSEGSTDDGSEGSEDPSPSDGSSNPSAPNVQTCTSGQPISSRPNTGATISGGRLTMPALKDEGYTIDHDYATAFTFAERMSTIYRIIEEGNAAGLGWVSTGGVGGLRKGIVESKDQAADLVMACMANNPALYSGFTGMTELESGPMKVDGHDAYSLVSELRVDVDGLEAEGDQVQVVVVDTGDDRLYGLYIFAVPIGDDELIALQEETIGEVTVRD
ncbi:DUF2510 domain-containing protein [Nocardioides sambongensis]|uniref:DUF2510 domain-containing protein n=1 Tax=Nocardioides sambongensis TaxID=2589074 RepID=UPI0015E87017|nr:DUF2510 domain-containing protein [Nocardioides sambongensis]